MGILETIGEILAIILFLSVIIAAAFSLANEMKLE